MARLARAPPRVCSTRRAAGFAFPRVRPGVGRRGALNNLPLPDPAAAEPRRRRRRSGPRAATRRAGASAKLPTLSSTTHAWREVEQALAKRAPSCARRKAVTRPVVRGTASLWHQGAIVTEMRARAGAARLRVRRRVPPYPTTHHATQPSATPTQDSYLATHWVEMGGRSRQTRKRWCRLRARRARKTKKKSGAATRLRRTASRRPAAASPAASRRRPSGTSDAATLLASSHKRHIPGNGVGRARGRWIEPDIVLNGSPLRDGPSDRQDYQQDRRPRRH